ncbi:MAG: ABC transporter permease [Alphaproteobacteria bacterium]|nr:ABC transporter permease [Alphaproteobacteria bacterium]
MSRSAPDAAPGAPARARENGRLRRLLAPVGLGFLFLGAWEWAVRAFAIPPYLLPAPSLIAQTLGSDGASLLASLGITLLITAAALGAAVLLGGLLALLMAQSRTLEAALFPYAVVLQVTPLVAIAPLIIIWTDNIALSLVICAWIVAFFPIVANTTLGLNSAARELHDLFRLNGATRWQTLRLLRVPAALPYFLAGLRISGGLALIGAVVAEFVAGTGGTSSGLASRILEAGYRLQIPRMFAALLLLSAAGLAIFWALSALSRQLLRHWHESALDPER